MQKRILTDKGFVHENSVEKRDSHVVIAELTGKVEKLSGMLKDRDEHWEKLRSVELVKLKDENSELKRRVNKMRKDIEQLNKRIAEKSSR